MYGPDRAFYELIIIFGPGQGYFFFTIFFGPGRAGPEDKIDGLDRAENLRHLQVYSVCVRTDYRVQVTHTRSILRKPTARE